MSEADNPDATRTRSVGEEASTARFLQLAGARPDASEAVAARVRESVHHAWQVSRRRARRRAAAMAVVGLALAAALVLVVRLRAPHAPASSPPGQIVAAGERIEGAPRVHRQADGRDQAMTFVVDMTLRAGDVIETDGTSRAALRVAGGIAVRLDRRSRARLFSPTVIELMDGAVYIATSDGSGSFEVRTRLGTVHDRGTRFEVRLGEASLRLRVRAGLVEILHRGRVVPARTGTEATVTSTGVHTRAVPVYGADWDWTASIAPPFPIEGRTLASFLDHLSREQGWTLRYVDTALGDTATRTVLHGSVEGLQAEEALGVALATSGLKYRLRQGELLVFESAGEP